MVSEVLVVVVDAVLPFRDVREDPRIFDRKLLDPFPFVGDAEDDERTELPEISAMGERPGLWSSGRAGSGLFLLRKGERKSALIGLVGWGWVSMMYK